MKLQNKQSNKNKEKALNSCIFQEIKRKIQEKTGENIEKRGKNMAIFSLQNLYNPVISRNYFSKIKKIKIP